MKPKARHFIPFFGFMIWEKSYLKEYFKAEYRGWEDANRALNMEMYHIFISLIIFAAIVVLLH